MNDKHDSKIEMFNVDLGGLSIHEDFYFSLYVAAN